MRFSASHQRGEGIVRRGFHLLPKGARGPSDAVFTLFPKGRGDCPTRFSPSSQRGEGNVRCGFHLLPKGSRGPSDAVFTFSLKGRGDRPMRFSPSSLKGRGDCPTRFSPSSQRGQRTVRRGGFPPLPFRERAGVRVVNAPLYTADSGSPSGSTSPPAPAHPRNC